MKNQLNTAPMRKSVITNSTDTHYFVEKCCRFMQSIKFTWATSANNITVLKALTFKKNVHFLKKIPQYRIHHMWIITTRFNLFRNNSHLFRWFEQKIIHTIAIQYVEIGRNSNQFLDESIFRNNAITIHTWWPKAI